MILDDLAVPIVLAPLAGGPSTPALTAAVSNAGGLGFLASGYLSAADLGSQIDEVRRLTNRPFGVNVFVPGEPSAPERYAAYERALIEESRRSGVDPGEAHFGDDDWDAKLALLEADPVGVVSFTFGCPVHGIVTSLQRAGVEVWITVTSLEEAIDAVSVGADALVLQGCEAGGHRGVHRDDPSGDIVDGLSLGVLLELVLDIFDVPCVASGGLMTGRAIAGVLVAGATAAQLGTAFLRSDEAGTPVVHRDAAASADPTVLTRVFTGRVARGVRNRFIDQYANDAVSAYPEVHYITSPLRRFGRDTGDRDVVNLWAGQAHVLGREGPAAEIVGELDAGIRSALAVTTRRRGK